MKSLKLSGTKDSNFPKAWQIYNEAFPSDEKRTLLEQEKVFLSPEYSFYVFFKSSVLVGLLSVWNFDSFYFLEHFAVALSLRGKGIGSEILSFFCKDKENIVLEVELPSTSAIAKRRISFYERLGFRLNNNFEYIQPSYGIGKNPVPMILMSYPSFLSLEKLSNLRDLIHSKVYGTKPILSLG